MSLSDISIKISNHIDKCEWCKTKKDKLTRDIAICYLMSLSEKDRDIKNKDNIKSPELIKQHKQTCLNCKNKLSIFTKDILERIDGIECMDNGEIMYELTTERLFKMFQDEENE